MSRHVQIRHTAVIVYGSFVLVLCYTSPVIAGSQDHVLRYRDTPGDLPAAARPRLRIQARRGQREAEDQAVAGKKEQTMVFIMKHFFIN